MTTSNLHEYNVALNVLLFAHDEEEALEITKAIKQIIENGEYKLQVDVDHIGEA
jgi:anti-sigma28 factor (negative regulator of flagellin synthesis)